MTKKATQTTDTPYEEESTEEVAQRHEKAEKNSIWKQRDHYERASKRTEPTYRADENMKKR